MPTPKQIRAFIAVSKRPVLDGITFNDSYNMSTFGITSEQYSALESLVSDVFGMGDKDYTVKDITALLAGKRVCLCYASPRSLDRVRKAFSKESQMRIPSAPQ